MKNLLLKLLKLIGKAKVVDLDNDGKIESINEEIQGLFSHFKTMSEQLKDANGKLIDIIQDEAKKQDEEKLRLEILIEEHHRKMEESRALSNKAQLNIEKNNKIKSKVDEFIV